MPPTMAASTAASAATAAARAAARAVRLASTAKLRQRGGIGGGSSGSGSSRFAFATDAAPATRRRRGASLPARAGARDAAMRELMASRDDRRVDSLKSKAPLVTNIEWQSPLSIISYPDPRLRAVNGRVGAFDDRLARLAREMFDVMYSSPDDGVGLAAPQVGVNLQLMVFNPEGDRTKPEHEVVLANPRIVSSSGAMRPFEEGCLSFPGIFGDVVRPERVKIKAQRLDGSKFETTISGWPARIFQHEYDHTIGILFHDRMEDVARRAALPRLARLEELWEQKHGEVPERAADGRTPV